MESAKATVDEPFGRQPKPVTVIFEGETPDCDYWLGILAARAAFKGDSVVRRYNHFRFTIYPRAVND